MQFTPLDKTRPCCLDNGLNLIMGSDKSVLQLANNIRK
jgi:hypothetical protein